MLSDAFLQVLQNIGSITFLVWMLGGVIIGIILGVIPGIGAMTGIALFLPFVFFLEPEQALPFIIAMAAAGHAGGSISAILLGIPGTPLNIVTTFDGYPMAQKGEAGRAMGAAVTASGLGGIISGVLALAMIFMIVPVIMAIISADMVFFILLGLVFVAILSKGSTIKGLISGMLGVMISFIGMHEVTGLPRFTFGTTYLLDGIPLVPLALGLFALPILIDSAAKGGTIASKDATTGGLRNIMQGTRDVFKRWWLLLRCAMISYFFGIIPGVGGEAATYVSYGQAKQSSKHPELFGTGIVEGVIAPETANNAKDGGAMLTTLALGVPGSAIMAMLIGALMMLALPIGPEMITRHLDISLTLIYALIVANLVTSIICFFTAPYMAKVTHVPNYFLVPLILAIMFVGSFAFNNMMIDIVVLLLSGIFGWGLIKLGYNMPALFLGYVLGWRFEHYFYLALQTSGPFFFVRPIAIVLIIIIIAILTYSPIKNAIQRRLSRKNGQ